MLFTRLGCVLNQIYLTVFFIITMSVDSEGQKIRTTLTFYYKRMKIKHREPLYLEKLTHAKNSIGMMLFSREVRNKITCIKKKEKNKNTLSSG